MKTILGKLTAFIGAAAGKPKVRKSVMYTLAIFFILQLYFVRELIAAELLFGMLFAALFVLGTIFYIIGAIGERSFAWGEASARVIAQSARRGYSTLEDLSKKPFRHPHSESAQ